MRVVVTGARGMVGSNVIRRWAERHPGDHVVGLTRDDVDFRDPVATHRTLADAAPDLVVHAAARVGGIAANMADPSGFLMDNLLIDSSVLRASVDLGVERLVYLGSSCMYPRDYRQPLVESDILAAPLEPTNEAYAIAKITGAKYCEYLSTTHGLAYRAIIPSNLYGPGDDYATGTSHLVAAAIAKTHAAKEAGLPTVEVWGDGTARREFTLVDDLAGWLVEAADTLQEWPPYLNVGIGVDHSVLEIYQLAAEATGFTGEFVLQPDRPAGMKQKLMDSSLAARWGWHPATALRDGMRLAYDEFVASTRRGDLRD